MRKIIIILLIICCPIMLVGEKKQKNGDFEEEVEVKDGFQSLENKKDEDVMGSGLDYYSNGEYKKALEQFEKISPDSIHYTKAYKFIEKANSKIREWYYIERNIKKGDYKNSLDAYIISESINKQTYYDNRKISGYAFLYSFGFPGAGYLYCEEVVKGVLSPVFSGFLITGIIHTEKTDQQIFSLIYIVVRVVELVDVLNSANKFNEKLIKNLNIKDPVIISTSIGIKSSNTYLEMNYRF